MPEGRIVNIDEVQTTDFGRRVPIKHVLAGLKPGEGLVLPAKRRSYIRKAYPSFSIKSLPTGEIVVFKAEQPQEKDRG